MGRITRTILPVLAGLSLAFLMTCENPLLSVIEYKVARAGGDPNIEVSYKGVVAPKGSSVDVGSALTGGIPRTATFTIANTGKAPLTLTGNPLVVIGGSNASAFSPATLPYKTIEAGTNSSFSIEFAPGTVGVKTATITIKSDDPDTKTYSLTIAGRGVSAPGPDIEVSQDDEILDEALVFDFGAVKTGATSIAVFKIKNVGTPGEVLHLASYPNTILFIGADAAQFEVTVQPPTLTIADGASTTFTVEFSTIAGMVQSYSATMRITSDDADEEWYDVALSGNGQEPDLELKHGIAVIPDEGTYGTSMGSVWVDGPGQRVGTNVSFTILNTGLVPLSIAGVSLTGTDPTDFEITANPASSVASGGQTGFSVRFDPSNTGTRTATVSIATDAPGSKNPYTFDITGTGIFEKKIYWAGRSSGEIYRANLDGTSVEVVLTGLSSPTGLAIDQTNNRMYFAEGGYIRTALLDGSGYSTILNAGSMLYGVAIDSNYIYWADWGTASIGRATLSGSGRITFSGGLAYGIVVDPASPYLYWSSDSSGNVYNNRKDNLSPGPLALYPGPTQARGMAYSDGDGRVFWGYQNGMVASYPPGAITAVWPSGIRFLAIDFADDYIFWTDQYGSVNRAYLSDLGDYDTIASIAGEASGIAVDLVP
jgi:hypothetical protein